MRRLGPLLALLAASCLLAGAAHARPERRHRRRPPPPPVEEPAPAEAPAEPPATDEAREEEPAKKRPEPVPPNDVRLLLKDVFAEPRFTFCHDEKYPLTKDEVRWCPLFVKSDPRCPAFATACLKGATATKQGTIPSKEREPLRLPELSLPGRTLLWLLLGAAVALLIYFLARHAIRQRKPDELVTEGEPEVVTGMDAAVPNVVETDVARLLELARAAAAAGDFGRAIEAAYAALLRKLEGAGLVRVEADRTNGDHLRDLGQAQPELRPPVAAVVAEVERVEFGGEPPTEERFRFVHDRVMGLLVQRMGPLLLLLGLGAFLGSCGTERGEWHRAPDGRSAVVTLLQKYGFEARERWAGLQKLNDDLDQLILVPGASIEDEGWAALRKWVQAGHTLVVAANRDLPSWLGQTSVDGKESAMTLVPEQAERFGRAQLALPVGDQLPGAKGTTVVLRGNEQYVTEWNEGEGRVVMFADDQLFNNIALLPADNARFLTELLRPGGKRVELASEVTGLVSNDPVTSVRRGKLAPMLLQLLALVILFLLYKGARFGRAVDPVSGQRRAFGEHARALGLKYARARATRYGLELYGAYALDRLRERLNLGPERSLSAIAEAISTRTGRPLGDVMRVLVQAREAGSPPPTDAAAAAHGVSPPPPPPSAEDLLALRQLASLLAQTGGSGERSRVEGKV